MWPLKTVSSTSLKGDGHEEASAASWEFSKALIGFVCRFVLIYGLLIAPWPYVTEAYAQFFRAGGNFLFGSFGSNGLVLFEAHPRADRVIDTSIELYNREQIGQSPAGGTFVIQAIASSRYMGYLNTAFVIALILATPIPWRRRGWALLWGVILIHGFIAFTLAILIIYSYYQPSPVLPPIEISPFLQGYVSLIYHELNSSLNFCLIMAVFIWLLVSFRREDWFWLLPQRN